MRNARSRVRRGGGLARDWLASCATLASEATSKSKEDEALQLSKKGKDSSFFLFFFLAPATVSMHIQLEKHTTVAKSAHSFVGFVMLDGLRYSTTSTLRNRGTGASQLISNLH